VMSPQPDRETASSKPERIEKSSHVTPQDKRADLLSALMDMALGPKSARSEAEALQTNALPDKP
jgi:hypothetical protein